VDDIGKVNASVGWFFVFVITSGFQILKIKEFPILDFKKRIQNKITNQFKALEIFSKDVHLKGTGSSS
jgi:hypothetical protein